MLRQRSSAAAAAAVILNTPLDTQPCELSDRGVSSSLLRPSPPHTHTGGPMACSGLRCTASSTQPGASATPAPSSSSPTSTRGWRCARRNAPTGIRPCATVDAPYRGVAASSTALLQSQSAVLSCCCGRSCRAASARTGRLPTRPPLRGSTCFQSMLQRTPATTSAKSSSGSSAGRTDPSQQLVGPRTDCGCPVLLTFLHLYFSTGRMGCFCVSKWIEKSDPWTTVGPHRTRLH